MRTQVIKCHGRNADGKKCNRFFQLHRLNFTRRCQCCAEGISKYAAKDAPLPASELRVTTVMEQNGAFWEGDIEPPPEAKL